MDLSRSMTETDSGQWSTSAASGLRTMGSAILTETTSADETTIAAGASGKREGTAMEIVTTMTAGVPTMVVGGPTMAAETDTADRKSTVDHITLADITMAVAVTHIADQKVTAVLT